MAASVLGRAPNGSCWLASWPQRVKGLHRGRGRVPLRTPGGAHGSPALESCSSRPGSLFCLKPCRCALISCPGSHFPWFYFCTSDLSACVIVLLVPAPGSQLSPIWSKFSARRPPSQSSPVSSNSERSYGRDALVTGKWCTLMCVRACVCEHWGGVPIPHVTHTSSTFGFMSLFAIQLPSHFGVKEA